MVSENPPRAASPTMTLVDPEAERTARFDVVIEAATLALAADEQGIQIEYDCDYWRIVRVRNLRAYVSRSDHEAAAVWASCGDVNLRASPPVALKFRQAFNAWKKRDTERLVEAELTRLQRAFVPEPLPPPKPRRDWLAIFSHGKI